MEVSDYELITWYIREISYILKNIKSIMKKRKQNNLSKTDEEDKIITDDALYYISGYYFINDNENIDRLHFCGWPSRLQGYNKRCLSLQTPLGPQPGLGIQHHFQIPADFWVEIFKMP